MIFDDVVKNAVESTPGAVAALIMGSDGIAISNYVKPEADLEMEVVGVEYAGLLGELQRVSDILQSGGVRELTVTTDRFVIVIRRVTSEYFLALALAPNGNIGKGRFMLRVQSPRVLKELQM